jgi:hypothetical protein
MTSFRRAESGNHHARLSLGLEMVMRWARGIEAGFPLLADHGSNSLDIRQKIEIFIVFVCTTLSLADLLF